MYTACFGLSQRPFSPAPVTGQYFPAEAIESARQTLTRCIGRAEGAAMVVGPSGTGKTLLCRVLAEQFRQTLAVALLGSGRLSSRSALYQAILFELRRSYRGMDEGELRLALIDYLTTCDDRPDGLILLVDEAHTLPLRLLDEIRMLTNLVGSGQSRVRVVLAGGPALEERFASPKLESFTQRLVVRCYLEPLGRAETQAYLQAQIDLAGGDGTVLFTKEAAEAVYRATDGVPRLINQVCDHAMVLACTEGKSKINGRTIEEAWADLQQLPTPWNDDRQDCPTAGVIEFGTLDDDVLDNGISDNGPTPSPSVSNDLTGDLGDSLDASEAVLSFEPAVSDPAEQVDQIEKTLAELDKLEREVACVEADDDPVGSLFQPAGTIGPEIELTFADSGNPFEEPYEEEEVIRQRYESALSRARANLVGRMEVATGTLSVQSLAKSSLSDVRPTLPLPVPEKTVQPEEPKAEPFAPTVPWAPTQSVELDDQAASRGRPRITVGRPSQYRQLFAKLKRG
ncbi:MAG: AAA family ATPase [Pirellulales bacterium]|nr:AAA family ATPase [Pirellulales bacterium]